MALSHSAVFKVLYHPPRRCLATGEQEPVPGKQRRVSSSVNMDREAQKGLAVTRFCTGYSEHVSVASAEGGRESCRKRSTAAAYFLELWFGKPKHFLFRICTSPAPGRPFTARCMPLQLGLAGEHQLLFLIYWNSSSLVSQSV